MTTEKPALITVPTIEPIDFQQYERYLPTAFDESLSILEKLNKMVYKLNQLGELTNEMLLKWNEVVEWVLNDGLQASVLAQLNAWLLDGTLADLINQALYGELKTKIETVHAWYLTVKDKLVFDADLYYINVRAWASKNGYQADETAINALIDANQLVTNPPALYLSGRWELTNPIVLKRNTHIIMNQSTYLIRKHNGYLMQNFLATDVFTGYTGNGNIKIQGGTLDANGRAFPSQASTIVVAHAENVHIEGVTFLDSAQSHFIEFNSSKNCKAIGNTFNGVTNPDNSVFLEAIQLDLSKAAPLPVYDNTPCVQVWIQNNRFLNCVRGVGSHTSTIGVWHEKIWIVDNYFENLVDWAIRPYSWNYATIKNNTIVSSPKGGIIAYTPLDTNPSHTTDLNGNITNHSQPSKGIIIDGNYIEGVIDTYGIQFYGSNTGYFEDCIVSNNEVVNNGQKSNDYPIFGRFMKRSKFTGNTVTGSNSEGMAFTGCDTVAILDNIVRNTLVGIYVTLNNYGIHIRGNQINLISKQGIFVREDSADIKVESNTVMGTNASATALDCEAIRFTTNVAGIQVIGNYVKNSDGYTATAGLGITSTCTNVQRVGNNWNGTGVADSSGTANIYGDVA